MPNTVLPFLGGVMLDKIGIRFGMILFTSILTLGQFVFYLGGSQEKFGLMLAGRVIFGLGGECMSVSQSTIVSNWFKGKELALALGLNISVSRLGSVWNSNVIPGYYDEHGLGWALMFGFLICVFSLFNALGIACVDKYAESKQTAAQKAKLADSEKASLKDVLKFKLPYWLLTGSCVVTYMSIFPYLQVVSDLI